MTKKRTKKDFKKAMNTLTKKEELEKLMKAFKETSLMGTHFVQDPKSIVEKGSQKLKEYFQSGRKDEKALKELERYMRGYRKAKNLDTHILLAQGVDPDHIPVVLDVIDELTKEYEVTKPQDKAYVQMAALAYSRYITSLSEYNRWKNHEFNSNERVGYMNMVSKDADRAFRQYNSVIHYFEVKKRPPVKINVKANTAFVAQNQQNVASSNTHENEINDIK